MKLQAMREQLARYTSLGKEGGTGEKWLPFLQEIERHIDALVDGLAAKEQIETMQDRIVLAILPGMMERNAAAFDPIDYSDLIDSAYQLAAETMEYRASRR